MNSFLSKITNPNPLNKGLIKPPIIKFVLLDLLKALLLLQQCTITIHISMQITFVSPVTIPNKPNTLELAGTWKARPVAKSKTAMKSKY